MPKISIIIPVYNAEKYLSATLDSVINQTFHDIEMVCINDGSTDESLQILRDYQRRDKRVKIVTQKNSGGSAARNAGIKHATGEYIMFLDADDMYAKNIVAHAYSRAVKTGVDILLYNFARFVGKPTPLAVKSKITPGQDLEFFTKDSYTDRFFNDFATITWNKFIKKSVLVNNKIFFDIDLSHNHDVDFSIRLMLAAKSYSWLDEVGYYYRTTDTGLTATKRSDPTNVLKILIKLYKTVISKDLQLKQSFDNYVADMIAGTLVKYGDDATKQKEVFDFAHRVVIPEIGLNKVDDEYIYSNSTRETIKFIKTGNYGGFMAYFNAPKRRLRAELRKIYDIAQKILSHFIV